MSFLRDAELMVGFESLEAKGKEVHVEVEFRSRQFMDGRQASGSTKGCG